MKHIYSPEDSPDENAPFIDSRCTDCGQPAQVHDGTDPLCENCARQREADRRNDEERSRE